MLILIYIIVNYLTIYDITLGDKVIFTEKPRDSVENIFDRSIEINIIKKVLDTGDWLAILGPRKLVNL